MEDWLIRHGLARGEAWAFEPRDRLGAQRPAKLVHEPRLPHPRLADDADELPSSGSGTKEAFVQKVQVPFPSDKRCEAALHGDLETGSARAHSQQSVGHDRLRPPSDR